MSATAAAAVPEAVLGAVSRLVSTVRTVYRGPAIAVEHAVVCLLSRGHLLIEDVPGVGKTTVRTVYRGPAIAVAGANLSADS